MCLGYRGYEWSRTRRSLLTSSVLWQQSGEDGSVEVIKGEAEKYPSKLVHRVENLRKHDPRGYKYNDEIPRGETVRVIVDKENLGVMTVGWRRRWK